MAVGEWDQRQLCSDGGCVGVIGPDGTCKVCGRAAQNWGDERNRGLINPPEDPAGVDDDDEDDDLEAGAAGDEADYEDEEDEDGDDGDDDGDDGDDGDEDEEADGAVGDPPISPATVSPVEWGTRQLCPDGSCIGLIGDDGRCKVCGRVGAAPHSRSAAAETAGSAAGFTVVTTDAAVATIDDAVQTTASTITTDEPASPAEADDADPAEREPGSKEPAS